MLVFERYSSTIYLVNSGCKLIAWSVLNILQLRLKLNFYQPIRFEFQNSFSEIFFCGK